MSMPTANGAVTAIDVEKQRVIEDLVRQHQFRKDQMADGRTTESGRAEPGGQKLAVVELLIEVHVPCPFHVGT